MITVHTICSCSDLNILNAVESVVNIIVAIIGGACAVKGICYIGALRKKRLSGTFSFWIQLRVRIEELHQALLANHSIINGLYSNDTRMQWEQSGAPTTDKAVERFYANAQETLYFIKNVSDQIPADDTWLKEYMKFVGFLIDIIQYDIRDSDCNFKFHDGEKLEQRKQYVEDICETMSQLLKTIEKQQNLVASRI